VYLRRHQTGQRVRVRAGRTGTHAVRTVERSEAQAGRLRIQQERDGRHGHGVSVRVGLAAVHEPREDVTPELSL